MVISGVRGKIKRSWKLLAAIITPMILLPIAFVHNDDNWESGNGPSSKGSYSDNDHEGPAPKFKLAYVILVMAVYWALEILPLPITALFPLVMFPLFGIDDAANVSKSYMKESNTIFLGGAIVALAVEYCNLHRRAALWLIRIIGFGPKRLMFGIMAVVSFLSMWISNTTCVTMIVPIIVAIVDEIHVVSDAADLSLAQHNQSQIHNTTTENGIQTSNQIASSDHQIATPNGIYSPSMRHSSVFTNRALSSNHHHPSLSSGTDVNDRSTLGTLEGHRSPATQQRHSHHHSHPRHLNGDISSRSNRNSVQRNGSFASNNNNDQEKVVYQGQLESTIVELESPTPSECDEIERKQNLEKEKWRKIKNMYLFALAYAANIGGTATITGTGPNKVFKEVIKPYSSDISQDGKYLQMTFFTWMAFNLPPMVVNVVIAWLYLVIKYVGIPKFSKKPVDEAEHALKAWEEQNVRHYLNEEYEKLGKITFHEVGVAIVFLLVVFLWILRDPQIFPGWNEPVSDGHAGDSTVALLGAVLLFIIPRNWDFLTKDGAPLETLLDWKFVTQKLPWGVLILLGSGYAIGDSADRTGLSKFIGKELYLLHDLPEPLLLFIVMIITTFITEVVSNTAAASVILPVLLGLSREMGIHPLYLPVSASVTASYAFMLPVASPVNAIVFAAGDFSIWEMITNGYILNGFCLLVFYINTLTLGESMFNYKDFSYPSEATTYTSSVLGVSVIDRS